VQLSRPVGEGGSDQLFGRLKAKKVGSPTARFGGFSTAAFGVLSLESRSLSEECAATG
jgi:hypothetical protein